MKKILLLAFVSMFAMQAHASTQELIDGVKNNNISRVLELLNNQENPNVANEQGNTALHYAVALDNADMTQILLSYGADLNAQNLKGWTPLKIAEKKDLKKVTPVLVQYLQLQKQAVSDSAPVAEAVAEVKEVVAQVPQQVENKVQAPVVEAVAEVKEAVAQVPQQVESGVQAPVMETVAEVKEVVAQVPQQVENETQAPVAEVAAEVEEVPTITQSQYEDMIRQNTSLIAQEMFNREQAEQKSIALQTELMKIKAEKEQLEKDLAAATKSKEAEKAEEKTEDKKGVAEPKAKEEPKKVVNKKPAPKPVKPVLKKKPVYHAPQPIVKKVVLVPSAMVEGIYAGDEEIVYCLDYLGNGENDSMKRAAGYFAASASISEPRYKEIVDKANNFFMKASVEDMTKRDNECSGIITPKDSSKQNQIVRSMNKSVGY